ncbi:MAG TPA: sugar phosphate isomerase/epimerase family protein, partial [Planctomycetota bacterium]|nr:sugar phosphate isomerase/epimerase family protein [Planctomycetota bacterium]
MGHAAQGRHFTAADAALLLACNPGPESKPVLQVTGRKPVLSKSKRSGENATMLPAQTYRIGYTTSGLHNHRLTEALHLLADLGYSGVFLTLDVGHLDPQDPHLAAEIGRIREILTSRDLKAVVETGARYLLDPRRKHAPPLLADPAGTRLRFLIKAIEVAAELECGVVSFFSGHNPQGLSMEAADDRLSQAIERLLPHARTHGVTLALEPEPGMHVERMDDFDRIRSHLGHPKELQLSLDCGHLLVTGEAEPADVIRKWKDHLCCVAIEDMKRGVHEHLPFGQGDMD